MSLVSNLSGPVKYGLDTLSIGGLLAVFVGILPQITAVAMLLWAALRISNEILERRIKQQEYELNARKLRQ